MEIIWTVLATLAVVVQLAGMRWAYRYLGATKRWWTVVFWPLPLAAAIVTRGQ